MAAYVKTLKWYLQAMERRSYRRALLLAAGMIERGITHAEGRRQFVPLLARLIPQVPKPIVHVAAREGAAQVDLLARFLLEERPLKANLAVTRLLTRWYESRGDYATAGKLFMRLASREYPCVDGGIESLASLTNNVGYDFLLAGDFLTAKQYFLEACSMYESSANRVEIANARANLLLSQFGLCPAAEWEKFLPHLCECHRMLLRTGDWRVRKTMGLFARLAMEAGRARVAIAWLRKAESAAIGAQSQLYLEDRECRMTLQDSLF